MIAAGVPDLEFTGERIVPGKTEDALFAEHEERYLFAGQYVAGKEVLDVACGAGIGTDYLRKSGAACCQGFDRDREAIEYATAAYQNCIFVQGDAAHLSLPDSSVDVVVSFETLEHVGDHKEFLLECKRVLRPNGLLICSTPNRTIYRWYGKNPYHLHELSAQEFSNLVAMHFGDLGLFSQADRIYPLFVLRLLASRILGFLKLKGMIKRITGRSVPAVVMRHEFSAKNGEAICRIRPYRRTWLMEPMYLIAVGRKISD